MREAFKSWFPLVVLATFLAGTFYVASQQMLRQSANDPQIQLAEDWSANIVSGTDPARLDLGMFIDPAHSLQPFGIVYDQDGAIVASSVTAPSTMKQPNGVFDSVDGAKDNKVKFTWQPASGERYAVVIKRANLQNKSYYVLAGRNLREVESREANVFWIVFVGWLSAIAATWVIQHAHLITSRLRIRKK